MTDPHFSSSAESCELRWARPIGNTFDEMRANVWKTGLADIGDTIMIWVNEGDLWKSLLNGVELKEYKSSDGEPSNGKQPLMASRPAPPVPSDHTFNVAQPVGMLGRENDAFHRALRKYPDAFEALHSFWNDAFAAQPPAAPVETDSDGGSLVERLQGRALYLRNIGEVKSPELMEQAAAALSRCSAATEDALGYAQRLATILWEKHWKTAAPEWKPLPDLVGVLTQIDNMVAGLSSAAPQTIQGTEAYRDTVRQIAAVREKRLAELVEENAQLRAELGKKRPETLSGMIAEVYGKLDAEDCAMIDREWARMRGYILPTNGTSTVILNEPQAVAMPLGMKAHPNSGAPFNPRDDDAYPKDDGIAKSSAVSRPNCGSEK